VLDLNRTPALERRHIAIGGKAKRVPKAHRFLHSKLALEGAERGRCVGGPVAPCRAGQPVLEEHPNDSYHGKAAIGDLSAQLLRLLRGIIGGQHLEAIVTRSA